MSQLESGIPVMDQEIDQAVPQDTGEVMLDLESESTATVVVMETEQPAIPAAAPQKGGMPQLDTDMFASQIFWLVITFAFLYLLLARSVLPRIHNVLEGRQNKITHDIDRAEQLRNEAEEARENYERALKDSRMKAQALIAESSALMEKTAASRHAELDKKLEQQLADAETRIQATKADALSKLAPVSKELAQQIVEKLTGQKLQTTEVSSVIDSLMKDKEHA